MRCNMDKIIERNGYIEQVWKVSYSINGFKYIILIRVEQKSTLFMYSHTAKTVL